jgi:hypothetical protein
MQLFDHQKKLLELNPDKWLLSWEMRVGKTGATLLLAKQKGGKTLIVHPKSVDWINPIKEWLNTDDYQVLKKGDVVEDKQFYICTKEYFRIHTNKLPICSTFCIDEGHHFSGWSSQIYKKALKYVENCQHVFILTGTPYRVSPFNLFCLANLLGKNLNWWKWQDKFYNKVKMGMKLDFRTKKMVPNMVPVLKKIVGGVTVEKYLAGLVNQLGNTVKLSDVAGETESEEVIEIFKITSEQKSAIGLLDDMVELVRRNRIFQILNGTLKSDGYNKNQYFKSEKFDRAVDIINNTQKLIVVCKHTLEIKRFVETIKDRQVFVLDGSTSAEKRQAIMADFNGADDAVVFVQSQVCEGYSLFAPIMMFYSLHNGFVEYSQMKSRPLMPNIKNVISYIYLIVDDKDNPYDRDCYENVVIKKQNYNYEIYNYEKN